MKYISELFEKSFQTLGYTTEIQNLNYKIQKNVPSYHFYFIYCLYLIEDLSNLPPKQYIIYQLEQHTNNELSQYYNRFEKKTLKKLYENSFLFFDYCKENIHVLKKKLNIEPYLLPIPFSIKKKYWNNYKKTVKKYDIIFIGLLNKRRLKILNYLKNFFTVGIPSKTIFGLDLVKFILQGKVLLNIHYYNDAILERVRLNEMISIGIPIISEIPNERDIEICQDYEGIVHFIERIDEPSLNLVQSIKNYHQDYDYHKINILEENFNNIFNKYFYEL